MKILIGLIALAMLCSCAPSFHPCLTTTGEAGFYVTSSNGLVLTDCTPCKDIEDQENRKRCLRGEQ